MAAGKSDQLVMPLPRNFGRSRSLSSSAFQMKLMVSRNKREICLNTSTYDPTNGVALNRTPSGGLISEAPDAIICSVGGGGLFNGIIRGKTSSALNPDCNSFGWSYTPVFAVETKGCDSLAASLAAGELVTLPAITVTHIFEVAGGGYSTRWHGINIHVTNVTQLALSIRYRTASVHQLPR